MMLICHAGEGGSIMRRATLAVIPYVVALTMMFQRYLIEGLSAGAVKG